MRGIMMIVVAAVFGLLAVFLAQSWLSRQAAEVRKQETETKPVAMRTVVVAKSPLRFGTTLTPQLLQEIDWPNEAVPANSFSSIAELAREKRVVLSSIEPKEPVLSTKITGPGQKATLSAVIEEGMKAVTIRVNDVGGVAGFVLPGDRVDVLITREFEKNAGVTDVVLQNIKVLGVDQIADEREEKPTVAKAVTLEVDIESAQKLALAANTGNLSLVLRQAGDAYETSHRSITVSDISRPASPTGIRQTTIAVIEGRKKQEFTVPAEKAETTGMVRAAGQNYETANP
jgi:pilus assembly protein CpaB